MLLYNPVQDNFMVFTPVETPIVEVNLPKITYDIPSYSTYTSTSDSEETEDNSSGLPKMTNKPYRQIPTLERTTQQTTIAELPVQKDSSNIKYSNNYVNLSFEDLIKKKNLPIRINSGYRGAGSLRGGKTALGRRSNHNRLDERGNPMAYDIAPKAGYTWEDLRKIMYKDPDVVGWFKARGWGILEEMMDGKRGFYDTNGGFHYTGATGPHFHIGPDSHAVKLYNSKIAIAQQGMKFDFPFMLFVPVEEPKVEINLPLLDDPLDISEWALGVTPSGTVIVKPNLPKMTNNGAWDSGSLPVSTTTSNGETSSTNEPALTQPKKKTSATVRSGKGADALSRIIDEVAQESGFEGLKDPETKQIIMLLAQRESNFNPKVQAKGSTAAGYFQFIDKSRNSFSGMSKDLFLNNPKELVRAAYKLFKYIHSTSDALKLLLKGYNKAQVTALGWWYPRSMLMVLNGKNNFSLGGYSILQALNDYK